MNLKKLIITLFFSLSLIGLAACTASPTSESTGQYLDSAAITAKVKATLADKMGLNSIASIKVKTYKGVVQLSGFVNQSKDIRQAVEITRTIPGVVKVVNSLVVK